MEQQLMEQLLSQYGGSNPQIQAMLSMMQQSNAVEDIEVEDSETERELAICKNKLGKAAARINQLKGETEELNEALSAMIHFGEELAHAVGACSFCWGEDPSCRACRGRGKPGVFEPDPVLFEKYVLPAYLKNKANLQ
jgi:hypothetical protein